MSDDTPLPKPIAVITGVITSTIAFITAIVGFILLWRGNTEIVSTVVIAVGIIGLWASLFYIRFSRKAAKKLEPTPSHRKRQRKPGFAFSQKMRYLALIGIYALPITAVSGIGFYYYSENKPSNEIVVLVADFDGPDPKKYGVTQFLAEEINDGIIGTFNDVKTTMLNETITASEGYKRAIDLAKIHNAEMIVWGWYVASDNGISVTYHITSMNFNTGFGSTIPIDSKVNLIAPIEQVHTFDFQSNQLTDNITYEILHSLFRSFQRKQSDDNVSLAIDTILEFLRTHRDSFRDYDELNSQTLAARAVLDYKKNGYDKSLQLVNDAISLYPSEDAYFNRGTIHLVAGNTQLALDDYTLATSIPTRSIAKHTQAYIAVGEIYNSQSNYDQAIISYTQGIIELGDVCTIINGCHMLHYYRGSDYLQVGDKQKAVDDFEVVKGIVNDSEVSKMLDDMVKAYK